MQDKSNLKIGVAIGLFVMAGAIFVYSRSDPAIPDDLGSKTLWYCTSCSAGFEIDGKTAPPDTFRDVEIAREESDAPRPRGHGKPKRERVAKCPTCQQYSGYAGFMCGNCNAPFRRVNSDGVVLICPECKWDPTTGREAEGDRLDVLD